MSNTPKVYTVAVLGAGARGGKVYARIMHRDPDKYKVTHLCDLNEGVLKAAGEEFGVPEENRYLNEENFFEK